MTDPEHQWIQAAQRGDTQAFGQLVKGHARRLHQVCQRLLGDATAAEDVLQDAFINAWRSLPGFDARSAFGTWLHRIAVNSALAHLRRRRPEVSIDLDDNDAPSGSLHLAGAEDPAEHASNQQFGLQLAGALEALSHAERSAFVLRHFEQYSLQEIAAVLGCNVNASKQVVFRAVRKLRMAMSPSRSES